MSGDSHDAELAGAVVGRALHALEPDEEDRVAEHLRTCGPCRALLTETHTTMSALAAAVAEVEPPEALRGRILAAAAAEPVAPPRPAPVPLASHSPRPVVPAARSPRLRRAALFAVAAVVAGVVVLSARGAATAPPTDERAQAAARADQVVSSARARDPQVRHASLVGSGGGPVLAVVLDDASGARVVPVDLPEIGPGRTFVLWRVAGGAASAVGTFDTTGTYSPTGSTSSALAQGVYAVSAEVAGPVPAEPSVVVGSGAMV